MEYKKTSYFHEEICEESITQGRQRWAVESIEDETNDNLDLALGDDTCCMDPESVLNNSHDLIDVPQNKIIFCRKRINEQTRRLQVLDDNNIRKECIGVKCARSLQSYVCPNSCRCADLFGTPSEALNTIRQYRNEVWIDHKTLYGCPKGVSSRFEPFLTSRKAKLLGLLQG